jgi:hypothetical protein
MIPENRPSADRPDLQLNESLRINPQPLHDLGQIAACLRCTAPMSRRTASRPSPVALSCSGGLWKRHAH